MIGVIKLYVCLECGGLFQNPVEWEETHNLDTPPYERFSGSPCCFSNYTTAYKCSCCGEYIVDSYIKIDSDERICGNCYQVMEMGDED